MTARDATRIRLGRKKCKFGQGEVNAAADFAQNNLFLSATVSVPVSCITNTGVLRSRLTLTQRDRVRAIVVALEGVWVDYEKAVDGFEQSIEPEEEIILWECFAAVVTVETNRRRKGWEVAWSQEPAAFFVTDEIREETLQRERKSIYRELIRCYDRLETLYEEDQAYLHQTPADEVCTKRIDTISVHYFLNKYFSERNEELSEAHKNKLAAVSLSPKCDWCHTPSWRLKKCAKCLKCSYCNKDCQKEAWKTHKVACKSNDVHTILS
ncbi:hypothetical protein CYMTET_33450 [Cymbomonas tetramitiformis]|uniref:MYND-type domain-containing protein n=1 Tax=Cymbomonas tetramitiformis TaxID=36881 RepID=A0AAE0FCT9_9CHLO|nr:hypothetical protein CYMTET_33450 [Cymbomonas tetramitiformis]|eukprot:gene841-1325_t